MGKHTLQNVIRFGSDLVGLIPGFQWAPVVGNTAAGAMNGGGLKGAAIGGLSSGLSEFGGATGSLLASVGTPALEKALTPKSKPLTAAPLHVAAPEVAGKVSAHGAAAPTGFAASGSTAPNVYPWTQESQF